MEELIYKVKNKYEIPALFKDLSFENNMVIFDIETTGLNPSYNKVILIGLVYMDNNNLVIEQLFCNHSKEESALLKIFAEKINDFDLYITFNGSTFDIPFLNKRFIKNNINHYIDPYLNIDLLKIVRKNKKDLGLSNCKLKTVEKFLGIDREDTIDGKESVRLYRTYENTQNKALKDKVLLHNYEDILHLVPTLNIVNYIDINDLIKYIPNQFNIYNNKFRIISHKITKDFLEIKGVFIGKIEKDYIYYNSDFDCILNKEDNTFLIKLPLVSFSIDNLGAYSYININKFSQNKINLKDLDQSSRDKYLVKKNKIIYYFNIYNFIKNNIIYIFDKINF